MERLNFGICQASVLQVSLVMLLGVISALVLMKNGLLQDQLLCAIGLINRLQNSVFPCQIVIVFLALRGN